MQSSQQLLTSTGRTLLRIGSMIFIVTAMAHLSCIYFGPQCYAIQMAPVSIVESAKANTLLAPVATVGVAMIFLVLAAYGLSAAKAIRRLPLLTTVIYSIAVICLIRGLLPLQLWIRHPHRSMKLGFL